MHFLLVFSIRWLGILCIGHGIWLSRNAQDSFPRASSWIHTARTRCHQFWNGQPHHFVVAQTDTETRVTEEIENRNAML